MQQAVLLPCNERLVFLTMRKNIVFILAIVVLCVACRKKESAVNFIVTQYGSTSYVEAGSLVTYHIQAFSNKNTVEKVTLSTLEDENGVLFVWDTIVNKQKAEFDYSYRVPTYTRTDMTKVTLTFTAYTSSGDETKMAHYLYVQKGGSLTAYDGIIMYSALSNNRNGFNISSAQTVYTSTADSASIDIYDYFNPAMGDSTAISLEWRSKTDIRFVRFNDFNFANATVPSLYAAYEAGAKYTSVDNLQIGDIIIVGRNDEALGVIQITDIHDEEGCAYDRYIFNFKKP